MSDETCWNVGCYNYGKSKFFCPHYGEKDEPVGQRGSEAGCYE